MSQLRGPTMPRKVEWPWRSPHTRGGDASPAFRALPPHAYLATTRSRSENPASTRSSLTQAMANQDILTILEQRLGRQHARDRLAIEKDHESQVFGQGINFFHFENLPLSHVLIGAVLMATGLYQRGISNAAKVDIRHNRIESPLLPKAFDGFTIIQLSDL